MQTMQICKMQMLSASAGVVLMQTFIPFDDIDKCAKVLDYKRLGKQRVEAFQILQAITFIEDNDLLVLRNGKYVSRAWVNHPCVLMWSENKEFLNNYAHTICREWISRGYNDNMISRFSFDNNAKPPSWWGREDIHKSHRSQLLAKNFTHYSQYFSDEVGLPYIWACV